MDVGELKHWVTLQQQTNIKSVSGRKTPIYLDIDEFWCNIAPMEGEELVEGAKVTSYIPHAITIRYIKGIDPTYRFRYVDDDVCRYFNVMSAFSPKEERVWLVCKCREDTSVKS